MSTRNKSFLRGAAILGLAGIFVKILGAVYQLPFAAMMGGTGLAYYKPAYDVYTVFIVISTSGIPVAVSRMVSERIIVQNHIGAHRVFKLSFKLMLTIGILSFAIMFFGADAIAKISAVPESALSMRFIAPALILVPIMAAFRGYYQGQQNMKPTALSQIFEQIFRVIFGLGTAYLMLHAILGTRLLKSFSATEKGAAGGAFGATVGSLAGLAVMLLVYLLVYHFAVGKKLGATAKSYGLATSDGEGFRLGHILKSAILALVLFLFAYAVLLLIFRHANTDIHVWTNSLRPFNAARSQTMPWYFLAILPYFALFQLCGSVLDFGDDRKGEVKSIVLGTLICLAGMILLLAFHEITLRTNRPFYTGHFAHFYLDLLTNLLPQFAIASALSAYLRKKTNSVYTGVSLGTAMLAFGMVCTNCLAMIIS